MICIRGATTVQLNDIEEILKNTEILLKEIIRTNDLNYKKIISIFFSCTKDITAVYPAQAARAIGLSNASLMCFQEMHVEGSLDKCIRVCIFYDESINKINIKNIYLNEAIILRPDLME